MKPGVEDVTPDMPLGWETREQKQARWEEARRRRHQPVNPPKQYTQEELRELGRRAREIAPKLTAATEQMNDALKRLEAKIRDHLGAETKGRVTLRKNRDGFIEHLVFKDGTMVYESGWPGEVRACPLLRASREVRILACNAVKDLWAACGGPPV